MEWSKIIGVVAIVSIVLLLLPSFFKGGQFDISGISNLDEKVSWMWKIIILSLGALAAYTLIVKQKEKAAWGKKDIFQIAIVVVILYLLWSNVLSPANIDILTQATANIMSVAGQLS